MGDHVPGGFVLLSRGLVESEVWRWDSHHIRFWVYLLLSVRARKDKPVKIGPVTVGFGQVLKSFRKIREENEYTENSEVKKWSQSRVGRMLDRCEAAGMIVTLGTDLGTLITVQNFARFQDFDAYRAELGTGLGTVWGRSGDNNKEVKEVDLTSNPLVGAKRERGPVVEMWTIWLEELGGRPPHPELRTGTRAELLDRLYDERLRDHADPLGLFRKICCAVAASDHHMSKRAYHLPESLFRNATRRERWTLDATAQGNGRARSGASMTPAQLRAHLNMEEAS